MKNLSPDIYRQRLVIEGFPRKHIPGKEIKNFLSQLSSTIEMRELLEPVTHLSKTYGWAGWIHWETSGAHFYAWDKPHLFFSVDIYTCKPFDNQVAVNFTKKFFNTTEIEYREF